MDDRQSPGNSWAGCYCGPQPGVANRQHLHCPEDRCPAEPVTLDLLLQPQRTAYLPESVL